MLIDEGYIKFHPDWNKLPSFSESIVSEIVRYRNLCYQLGFIGITDGIGYGNISIRFGDFNQFIISGTQTGHLKRADKRHFTLVTEVDFKKNSLKCAGPVNASSESLTHAMFYRLDKKINSVIHVHHPEMWSRLKYQIPTTSDTVAYGTIEMCEAVKKLFEKTELKKVKIMAMAGHQDGLISFGINLKESLKTLLRWKI